MRVADLDPNDGVARLLRFRRSNAGSRRRAAWTLLSSIAHGLRKSVAEIAPTPAANLMNRTFLVFDHRNAVVLLDAAVKARA